MRRSVDNFPSVTAYYTYAILRKATFWREHPFKQNTLQFTCRPQLFQRWIINNYSSESIAHLAFGLMNY